MHEITEWLKNNIVEIIGASFALIYLILEVKQKWTMWIIGFISSTFYVYIFFTAKLYAEMGLNIYYVIMSVYGLYCWKFSLIFNKKTEISHITFKLGVRSGIIAFLLSGFMAYILIRFTDSPVPYPDALIASLSIIATWMVTKKIVEHWYLWIFVNSFSIGLYIYQELYPTAILFIIYSFMSVIGLIEWRKTMKQLKQI